MKVLLIYVIHSVHERKVRIMFSAVVPYKNQHYDALKKECLENKKLFEDPEFPCTNASLFYKTPLSGRVEWKRPKVSDHTKIIENNCLNNLFMLVCSSLAALRLLSLG